MKVLIVEDEELAAKKLQKNLLSVCDTAVIVGVTDSIKTTVEWLQENPHPDLILMDIELSDGQSFQIFNLTEVKSPVIFTTSYDEFALKAFKVNSVDYLLKPVQKDELETALDKLSSMKATFSSAKQNDINISSLVKELQQTLHQKEY